MGDRQNRFPAPKRRDRRDDEAPLAWCGWELPIASGWRPLHIEGAWHKGTITVGAPKEPIFKVSWWRPGDTAFAPRSWMETRARVHGASFLEPSAGNVNFSEACTMPDTPASAWADGVWCGYSGDSDLAVEVGVFGQRDPGTRRDVLADVVPGLSASHPAEPTPWAVYDASFESPAGFTLKQWRLDAGDLSLHLTNGQDETLMVRQVYPETIPLDSPALNSWLESTPFNQRFKRSARSDARSVEIQFGSQRARGIRVSNRNALSFPLSRARRRNQVGVGLNDPRDGRVLLMQIESRKPWARGEETRVLSRMNWHRSRPDS